MIAENTTDKKINAKYLQITTDMAGKREYNLSKLVVDNEEKANEIFDALSKVSSKYVNYKFNSLYKKYSINNPQSFKDQYILETLIPSDILSEFEAGKVIAMKGGGNNFYIFKISGDSRTVEIPKLDDPYKKVIKNILIKEVMQKFIEKSIKDKEVEVLDNLK